MRTKRKPIEDYYIQKLMDCFRIEIDENATEIPEITDKPDLAISTNGKVIGIEFPQLPSSYIIEKFHKKRQPPKYTNNVIEGHLTIYPFEPHRAIYSNPASSVN